MKKQSITLLVNGLRWARRLGYWGIGVGFGHFLPLLTLGGSWTCMASHGGTIPGPASAGGRHDICRDLAGEPLLTVGGVGEQACTGPALAGWPQGAGREHNYAPAL